MQVYSGSLYVAAAALGAAVDIDPAERAGYVNEVVAIELLTDVAATPGKTMFVASVKVPVRSTFDESEMFAPDVIARSITPNSNITRSVELGLATHPAVLLDEDSFFQNTLRVGLWTRDGLGAANAETIYYRVFVEERKLTDSVRNTINMRSYS